MYVNAKVLRFCRWLLNVFFDVMYDGIAICFYIVCLLFFIIIVHSSARSSYIFFEQCPKIIINCITYTSRLEERMMEETKQLIYKFY